MTWPALSLRPGEGCDGRLVGGRPAGSAAPPPTGCGAADGGVCQPPPRAASRGGRRPRRGGVGWPSTPAPARASAECRPARSGRRGGWVDLCREQTGVGRERAAAGGGGGIAGARLCGTIRTSITTARKPAPPPTRPLGDDVGGRRLAAGPWPGQGGAAMTRVHLQLLISGGRRSTTGGRGDGGWTAQSQLWRGVPDAVVPAHLPPRW